MANAPPFFSTRSVSNRSACLSTPVILQLTEDSCGTFTTAYVLDADITPEMRKSAARQAQQQLAVCMQEWGIPLMKSFVPEKEKYEYLEEAASHLMQVLNAPECIMG